MFGLFNILIVLRSLHNSPAFHSHAGDSDSEEEVHTEIVILPGFTRLCCNFRYFNLFFPDIVVILVILPFLSSPGNFGHLWQENIWTEEDEGGIH